MWEKNKKQAYEIKIPLPIENHVHHENDEGLIEKQYIDEQDIDKAAIAIHARMQNVLKPNEWTVYKGLFIDNLTEEQVAKNIGYRTSEKGREAGYRQIINMKKAIIIKVKKELHSDNIDLI